MTEESPPRPGVQMNPPPHPEGSIVPPGDSIFLIASVILFDVLIHPVFGATGFGIAVFLWAFGLWAMGRHRIKSGALLIILLIGLLAVRNVWKSGFLSIILPLLLTAIMAALQRSGIRHWLEASIAGMASPLAGIPRLLGHLTALHGRIKSRREKYIGDFVGWIVPGIAGFLILWIFGAIFVSANPVMDQMWEWAKKTFQLENFWDRLMDLIFPDPGRLGFWIVIAVVTSAFLRPIEWFRDTANGENQEVPAVDDEAVIRGRTAAAALISACTIFTLYVAIDISFIWIKMQLPEGITDSQYARRGTGWLTLALALSTVVIGGATSKSVLGTKYAGLIRVLAFLWVGLDVLMSTCVLGRINMYISNSGLTPLRITGIFGTLIVMAGVAGMAVKVYRSKNLKWLIRRYAVIFIVGISLFAVFPEDFVCGRYNAQRVLAGDLRPLHLIFSSEIHVSGLCEYMPLLDHPDPVVAEGISEFLSQSRDKILSKPKSKHHSDWRRFQWGRARSMNRLDAASERLKKNEGLLLDRLKQAVIDYRRQTNWDDESSDNR